MSSDASPQALGVRTGGLLLRGIAEDFANFFLDAAAMTLGGALEFGFYGLFQIANYELRQVDHPQVRYRDITKEWKG
jgi:hypothetical protein